MRNVYLDHQAASPMLPEVFEAMKPHLLENFGNPSSLHRYGLKARDVLQQAREQFARFIQSESPEDIIFTSNGTEAVNLAIKGVAFASRSKGNHIVLSEIEHPAVLNSVEFLERHGFTATRVRVDSEGKIDPEDVRQAITPQTILIACHLANYDIGTIAPVEAIGRIAQEMQVPLFVDAMFAAGWMPVDVRLPGIQLMAFSPHRFYGPKGAGVLYRNRGVKLENLIHGGVQEGGRRAGTENVSAIAGAGAAAEIAARDLEKRVRHVSRIQQRLIDGICSNVEYVKLNGPAPGPQRICQNINISAEFIEGEAQLLLLDLNGISVASGSGCVSKALKVSHVLKAIGVDHALAQGSIILTPGMGTSGEDVDYVLETYPKIVTRLRSMSPGWDEFVSGTVKSAVTNDGIVRKD